MKIKNLPEDHNLHCSNAASKVAGSHEDANQAAEELWVGANHPSKDDQVEGHKVVEEDEGEEEAMEMFQQRTVSVPVHFVPNYG